MRLVARGWRSSMAPRSSMAERPSMAGRSSMAVRWVVGVAVALVVLGGAGVLVVGFVAGGHVPDDRAPALAPVIERTLAAGSARFAATYQRRGGAAVRLVGITSFAGPASVVTASVGAAAPIGVRVSASGAAWVREPSSGGRWLAVSGDRVAGPAGVTTGWADVVRSLDRATDEVELDATGRVVHLRRRTAGGDVLDVRFHDFGAEVVDVPP